jgi:hypothetical protein
MMLTLRRIRLSDLAAPKLCVYDTVAHVAGHEKDCDGLRKRGRKAKEAPYVDSRSSAE